MKPCSTNRKRITWLALNALDARNASTLLEHLARCEGCRHYWEEISRVTERLASAAPQSTLEASELFHRRVAEKLQAIRSDSALGNLACWLRGFTPDWRVALPLIALLAVALFAVVRPLLHQTSSPSGPPAIQAGSPSHPGSDPAPTLANYAITAGRSLEELDGLLTRQGNTPLPPAPVYTAFGLELAKTSF